LENTLQYKGYSGSIEWVPEDQIFFGKILNVGDLIMYEAVDELSLADEFRTAVDEYIYFKEELDL
jgi:predicted HicB family RNase H-like nuclease